MKLAFAIMILLSVGSAQAQTFLSIGSSDVKTKAELTEGNHNFTFASAELTFPTAQIPTEQDLAGDWTLIGYTTILPWTSDKDGYWPDGKITLPGQAGYYLEPTQFSIGAMDSLGNKTLTVTQSVIGFETGKVYSTAIETGVLSASGAIVQIATKKDDGCATTIECRLVPSTGALLCAFTVTDGFSQCAIYESYLNRHSTYIELARPPRT